MSAVAVPGGTHLDSRAPWETYGAEMESVMTPELAAAVAEYSEKVYDECESSSQSKEELARQIEMNRDNSKEYQFVKEEEYEDVEQRIGRVMHSSVFITKLRDNGVKCWYTQHPHDDKLILLVQMRDGVTEPEVACWVQNGFMPELSIMRFDIHGVPEAERRRGWRTCLLQIILKGIMSEDQANKVFGNPKQTEAFDRYNSTLRAFRNAGNSLGE